MESARDRVDETDLEGGLLAELVVWRRVCPPVAGCDGFTVRVGMGGSCMVNAGCFLDLNPIAEASVLNLMPEEGFAGV